MAYIYTVYYDILMDISTYFYPQSYTSLAGPAPIASVSSHRWSSCWFRSHLGACWKQWASNSETGKYFSCLHQKPRNMYEHDIQRNVYCSYGRCGLFSQDLLYGSECLVAKQTTVIPRSADFARNPERFNGHSSERKNVISSCSCVICLFCLVDITILIWKALKSKMHAEWRAAIRSRLKTCLFQRQLLSEHNKRQKFIWFDQSTITMLGE